MSRKKSVTQSEMRASDWWINSMMCEYTNKQSEFVIYLTLWSMLLYKKDENTPQNMEYKNESKMYCLLL